MANNGSQGAYAPLPQNMSDSDSEKESTEPHNRLSFTAKKLQNGHDNRNGYPIPTHIVNLSKKKGFFGMTRARKVAFVSSILLCFLVIIIFLWILPCNSDGTCPTKITSWKNEHEGLEFKGKIDVVRGLYKNSLSLVVIGKKPINSVESHSGALALKISDGGIEWFVQEARSPTGLDCNLIDVNGDGIKDCLVLGEIGLEAVNSITGEIIWHLHNYKMLISNVDLPKLLPDLNGDGINEMITVTDWNSYHNKVITICGMTGKLLTEFIMKACVEIPEFKFEDNYFIFLCKNASRESYLTIPLNDLKNKYLNSSYFIKPTKIGYQPQIVDNSVLNNRQLIIKNEGVCPVCRTNVAVLNYLTKKPLWTMSSENTYTIQPATFSFKSTTGNLKALKGHINGFILKLWQWPNNNTAQRNNISEKVVLITFNDVKVHVINVSYVQVTQLCLPDGLCQPDFVGRNESMLITDLDFDGEQELISYSSSYVCEGEQVDDCRLVSTIEVVRLEAELPKLYAK